MCDNDDSDTDKGSLRPPRRASVQDDEDSLRPPRRTSIRDDDALAVDKPLPSKEASMVADPEEKDLDADAIIDEMSLEDLRGLTKRILMIAESHNDERILLEINSAIQRQHHQRQKQDKNETSETETAEAIESVNRVTSGSMTPSNPFHPDSIHSLPPLHRSNRSHDSDSIDAPTSVSPNRNDKPAKPRVPMSPTVRTSNTQRRVAIPHFQNDLPNIDEKKERQSKIPGFGKRQLVVLCNRNPATEKEMKDQDLAMTLCKRMGIIPCVIVSSLSSQNTTPTKEEQLLVDAMGANNIDKDKNTDSNSATTYLYPQFFVRNIIDVQDIDKGNAMIDYKGDYETMEKLYQTGMFGASSLEAIPVSSARGLADATTAWGVPDTTTPWHGDDKETLESFIRQTSKPVVSRAGNERGNASVGDPSLPSPHRGLPGSGRAPIAPRSKADQPSSRSLSPIPSQSPPRSTPSRSPPRSPDLYGSAHNSSSHSYRSGSVSMQLSNSDSLQFVPSQNSGSVSNGDPSFSHLDGMNQPKSQQNSLNSGFGEMSLGDDLRMIFDIESDVVATSTVQEVNETPSQPPAGVDGVHTITEDGEEGKESIVTSTWAPTPLATVPTITEEEEDVEEEEEEEEEKEDGDEHEECDGEKSSEPGPINPSSVSMTVQPSGEIVKKETITLKPRQEPPGTMAFNGGDSQRFLDIARSSLRSPSSPDKRPFKPDEPAPKKIINPYYALASYNGGDSSQEVELNLSAEKPATPQNPSSKDPLPSKDPSPSKADPIEVVTNPGTPDDTTPKKSNTMQQNGNAAERENSPWEKKFLGIGACYLVFDSDDNQLKIHYSESPMSNAVGVWTSPDIGHFKKTQGLSECELIGICAENIDHDIKHYCQGWCQFIKAGKIMEATVTALVDVGLPVEFYVYDRGRTLRVSPCDGEAIFDTKTGDAIACVPKGCDFPPTGIVGKKWGKIAKKLGSVALFKSLSVRPPKVIDDAKQRLDTDNIRKTKDVDYVVKRSKEIDNESLPSRSSVNSKANLEISVPAGMHHESASTLNTQSMPSPEASIKKSLSSTIIDHASPIGSRAPSKSERLSSPKAPPTDEGACFLVYDPDSSGCLVEHYIKTPVDSAIGRWVPGEGKRIAGFKFKRNHGRNVLIKNCSGGVQGRKNFYSGWCQFVRSAKIMNADVTLWDPAEGQKGLKVDVCFYYDDPRPHQQTVRLEEGASYTTNNLRAVACLPKGTPFFESMAVDLVLWLAEANKNGYSSTL